MGGARRAVFGVLGAAVAIALGACASTNGASSSPPPAIAGGAEAREQVERLNAALLDVAERSRQLGQTGRESEIRAVALEIFDVPGMARASLASAFSGLSSDQQARWIVVYTDFHVSAIAYNWRDDRGARFEYLGEEPAPDDRLLVKTLLDRAGTGVDVRRDYLLERGAGEAGDRWRVVDVFSPKSVSLVGMRRAEYQTLLDRRGFDALVRDMEATIASRRND